MQQVQDNDRHRNKYNQNMDFRADHGHARQHHAGELYFTAALLCRGGAWFNASRISVNRYCLVGAPASTR